MHDYFTASGPEDERPISRWRTKSRASIKSISGRLPILKREERPREATVLWLLRDARPSHGLRKWFMRVCVDGGKGSIAARQKLVRIRATKFIERAQSVFGLDAAIDDI